MSARILVGDVLDGLAQLPDGSVHCAVTSPPYFGLRDYGHADQIGLEPTLGEYVERLVKVFAEVARVLRPDGTLWLNLGDSYSSGGRSTYDANADRLAGLDAPGRRPAMPSGIKPKDLLGVPWTVALALRADGWYLRSEIIWHKRNPNPESVKDRPTSAHEHLFLLARSAEYFYDHVAVREPSTTGDPRRPHGSDGAWQMDGREKGTTGGGQPGTHDARFRNLRDVWPIVSEPLPEAHFATFPTALVWPCILAGTSERGVCAACGAPWRRLVEIGANEGGNDARAGRGEPGHMGPQRARAGWTSHGTAGWEPGCSCDADVVPAVVLDPFTGSGTTGVVAGKLRRDFVGCELNADYAAMAQRRIRVEGRPAESHRLRAMPDDMHQDGLF